jgi:hypothetical protein
VGQGLAGSGDIGGDLPWDQGEEHLVMTAVGAQPGDLRHCLDPVVDLDEPAAGHEVPPPPLVDPLKVPPGEPMFTYEVLLRRRAGPVAAAAPHVRAALRPS